MKKSLPIILAASALTLGIRPPASYAQTAIELRVDSKGKTVYTNNIADNPEPPPKAIVAKVPPPAAIVAGTPAAAKKLRAAVSALAKPGPGDDEGISAAASTSADIAALITAISLQYGVDPELVAAVIKAESNYNQWAVSSKGARGLMQLIPATGQRFGVRNLFDARDNIQGGVRYLRFLLEKFDGNIELSLAAYNAGEGVVERLGRIPPYDETRTYVNKIRTVFTKKSALLLPLPMAEAAPTGSTSAPAAPAAASTAPAKPAAVKPAPVQAAPVVQAPEEPRIYSRIDARGNLQFSSVGPLD